MPKMLKDKNILLGVCGSIASYKAAELTRLFVKAGANVKIIMTKDATSFITPLTLSTLSKNPVLVNYYSKDDGVWNNHVELGLWANYMVIAPATANTIAKFALGLCDNLLSAAYLSAKCPVFIAPAMDLDMWKHPGTKKNIEKVSSYGNHIIHPKNGELASGLHGEGRLAEPLEILEFIENKIAHQNVFKGKKVLITAGPTYEAIDPVRFIGNHSSGKMGYALAEEFLENGAEVILISGPTALEIHTNIKRVDVTSAQEMLDACLLYFDNVDFCIMSAAVADYTPKEIAAEKIKNDIALNVNSKFATNNFTLNNRNLVSIDAEAVINSNNSWNKSLYKPLSSKDATAVSIKLIPYFAWGNKGKGEMTVWMSH